jgi:mannosyltransferase OCH1-like enzyme
MIPKTLYFTFKTPKPPEKYLGNLHHWHAMCQDWDIHYFSDRHIYQFFEKFFPEYFPLLPKISYGASLADVFRYAILYVYGGMYSDIDTVLLRKIPQEWLSYQAVIGYEHQPSSSKFSKTCPKRRGNKDIFCQWTLLSSSQTPLFKEALDEAFRRLEKNHFRFEKMADIYQTTGPHMFTEIVKKHLHDPTLLFLDMDYFGAWERSISLTERSVIRHLFHGYTRWKQELEFPQFRFY